jgi:branched-chain amino acid transport system permease protein
MKPFKGILSNSPGWLTEFVLSRPTAFMVIIALVICSLLPLFLNNFWLSIMIMMFSMIISALGIQVLTGYTGQLSSGHCAFMAIGAYTSAILTYSSHFPFWLSVPIASLVAGIAGIIIGLTSIRLKGFYLIISTIAAQVIILYVIVHWVSLTGGAFGMTAPAPSIGDFSFDRSASYFYIALAALVVATYLTYNIVRTNIGRAFIAIRDNELSAQCIGINVTLHKLLAFFIGCALAGLGGAIAAHARGVITPDSFSLMESFNYLGYIIVGGIGTITGVFFGVIFFMILNQGLAQLLTASVSVFPSALNMLSPIMLIILGIMIALFITIQPRGFAYIWQMFTIKLRLVKLQKYPENIN